MGILVSKNTRLLVQNITGREGQFHTGKMLAYGTRVVAGVTPGRGGQTMHNVPVYNTVAQAMAETAANASIIFVPPAFAADAIMEAVDTGVSLVICITEGIPVKDMVEVLNYAQEKQVRLIGPNCPGLITPGACLAGILPGDIFTPGAVGLISRSGTLTYEVVHMLTEMGIGQSTCVGIGGDPLIGTRFVDVLRLFAADVETEVIILIGEIGGADEEEAAAYIRQIDKPVVAFISGRTAPPGKRMGHAGAIISGNTGTAASKVAALTAAGVSVAATLPELVSLVAQKSRRTE